MDNRFEEIENSEEFKKSIKENQNISNGYKNQIATKILNVSTVVSIVGFLIAIIGSYNLYSNHEDIVTIIVLFSIVMGIGMLASILLKGLAEIIELLQSIKDK